MNSKQKGSRGERACRDVWKKHGYEEAHRSQQYSGKGESSADLEGISELLHIEVKSGYSYKIIYDFLEQAERDAKENQIPIVNCKMDRKKWLAVLDLEKFIEIFKVYEECKEGFTLKPGGFFTSITKAQEYWEQREKECDGCSHYWAGRCLDFMNGCNHGNMNTSRRTKE